MKITVIVPIYKVESFLKQCVDSIIRQTYRELEIILVDDGSPDGCPTICDAYAEKDSRIKVIHKQNGGLIAARKSGVEIATGDYITFVDGDDWIAPDMYQKVADSIEKYNADCVITQFYFAYEDHQTASQYLLDRKYYSRQELENDVYPKMLFRGKWYQFGIFPNCWTKVFKADIIRKHIFAVNDRIRLGEDIAFTYPCLMDCQSLSFVDEPLYYYRQNPNSMTAAYDKRLPDIYLLPYNAVKDASETLKVDLSNQLPYYLLYLINFVIRNEATKDNQSDAKTSKKVLTSVILASTELRTVPIDRLPIHIRILLLSLKLRSVSMLKLYQLLMQRHIR